MTHEETKNEERQPNQGNDLNDNPKPAVENGPEISSDELSKQDLDQVSGGRHEDTLSYRRQTHDAVSPFGKSEGIDRFR
jgi:hypothetical protein